MLMSSVCQRLPCLLHAPLRWRMLLTLAVAYANVYPHYWSSLMWSVSKKQTVAGTLSLKIKCNHCLFCCSVAETESWHLCWFLQPTTEQFSCLALSDDIAKHCYLTTGHTELHLGDESPPLEYLRGEWGVFSRRGGQPMKISLVVTWPKELNLNSL